MKCLESDHNTVKATMITKRKTNTFLEWALDSGTLDKSIYVSGI